MTRRQLRPATFRAVLAVLPLLLLLAAPARADWIVAEGWDLFETADGTFFDPGGGPLPFDGLPIEQFDFGGSVGVQDVGTADTIVQRLADADSGGAPGSDTIPIEMVALQLVSTDGSNLFITLQSERDPTAGDPAPGPPSTGTMEITFDTETSGTFDSILDVWFDVRLSSPTGPIVQQDVKTLTSTNVAWDRTAPADALTIEDVNHLLKGDGTTDRDFWPDDLTETNPDAEHVVGPARVPEFCVGAGWDLFETIPPTTFNSADYEGVPLGSFDFGGTIGTRSTGTTDTIVRRDQNALGVDPGDSATIPIEMVELQLRSVDPVDLGSGLDTHWVTLQSNRGAGDPAPGPPSQGTMTFTFDSAENGTFNSSLDVWFDVRQGSPDGPIVLSGNDRLRNIEPVPWDRTPPPGAEVISGVNFLLVQDSPDWDFWPEGPGPDGGFSDEGALALHTVRSAQAISPIPGLGSAGVLALALLLAGLGFWAVRHGA